MIGLLHEVREVVMSSRISLELLIDHIGSLPERFYYNNQEDRYYFDNNDDGIPDDAPAGEIEPYLDPNLKFTILYGGSTGPAPAKIIEHVPESAFRLEMSPAHLKSLNGVVPLHEKVDFIFKRKLGIFADVLRCCCCKTEVPEALLHHILPFLWGGKISNSILKEVVAEVGNLLSDPKDAALKVLEEENEKTKAAVRAAEVKVKTAEKKVKTAESKMKTMEAKMKKMEDEVEKIKGDINKQMLDKFNAMKDLIESGGRGGYDNTPPTDSAGEGSSRPKRKRGRS